MKCVMDKCPSFARLAEIEARLALISHDNERLAKENKELRARLSQNSSNSSKPPSQDGYNKKPKPVNLRKKIGRKTGGQPGHPGKTIEWSATPDSIERHLPDPCQCGHHADEALYEFLMARQVHDLPPPPKIEVTEHQVFGCKCPCCGRMLRGVFPEGVDGPVQYGKRINAIAIYLAYYQFVPLERCAEAMRDLFGIRLSEGTIVNMLRKFSEAVKGSVDLVWELLLDSDVVHFDESGMRALGRLRWLHLASTKELTYYRIHDKRGGEAFDGIGLLPLFKGKAVHDFWKPYLTYEDIIHCLCVAHLLRELKMAHEQYGQRWAERMIELLVKAHDLTKSARAEGRSSLAKTVLGGLERKYASIIREGLAENGLKMDQLASGRRGAGKTKPINLLARFNEHEPDILRFAKDMSVPFDNNLAERDIRMGKLRGKISGAFRGKDGGADFFNIRSYISTARKNAVNVFDAIIGAFAGKPFIPQPNSS